MIKKRRRRGKSETHLSLDQGIGLRCDCPILTQQDQAFAASYKMNCKSDGESPSIQFFCDQNSRVIMRSNDELNQRGWVERLRFGESETAKSRPTEIESEGLNEQLVSTRHKAICASGVQRKHYFVSSARSSLTATSTPVTCLNSQRGLCNNNSRNNSVSNHSCYSLAPANNTPSIRSDTIGDRSFQLEAIARCRKKRFRRRKCPRGGPDCFRSFANFPFREPSSNSFESRSSTTIDPFRGPKLSLKFQKSFVQQRRQATKQTINQKTISYYHNNYKQENLIELSHVKQLQAPPPTNIDDAKFHTNKTEQHLNNTFIKPSFNFRGSFRSTAFVTSRMKANNNGDNANISHQWHHANQQAAAQRFRGDRRPLLGEGGILTNVCSDKLMDSSSGVQSFAANKPSTHRANLQRRQTLVKKSENCLHNYRPGAAIYDRPGRNLHPLEISDRRARMSISIYDPLPPPNKRSPLTTINQQQSINPNSRACTNSNWNQLVTVSCGQQAANQLLNCQPQPHNHNYSDSIHSRAQQSKDTRQQTMRTITSHATPNPLSAAKQHQQALTTESHEHLDTIEEASSFFEELKRPILDMSIVPSRDNFLTIRLEQQVNGFEDKTSKLLRVDCSKSSDELTALLRAELIKLSNIPDHGNRRLLQEEAESIAKLCHEHWLQTKPKVIHGDDSRDVTSSSSSSTLNWRAIDCCSARCCASCGPYMPNGGNFYATNCSLQGIGSSVEATSTASLLGSSDNFINWTESAGSIGIGSPSNNSDGERPGTQLVESEMEASSCELTSIASLQGSSPIDSHLVDSLGERNGDDLGGAPEPRENEPPAATPPTTTTANSGVTFASVTAAARVNQHNSTQTTKTRNSSIGSALAKVFRRNLRRGKSLSLKKSRFQRQQQQYLKYPFDSEQQVTSDQGDESQPEGIAEAASMSQGLMTEQLGQQGPLEELAAANNCRRATIAAPTQVRNQETKSANSNNRKSQKHNPSPEAQAQPGSSKQIERSFRGGGTSPDSDSASERADKKTQQTYAKSMRANLNSMRGEDAERRQRTGDCFAGQQQQQQGEAEAAQAEAPVDRKSLTPSVDTANCTANDNKSINAVNNDGDKSELQHRPAKQQQPRSYSSVANNDAAANGGWSRRQQQQSPKQPKPVSSPAGRSAQPVAKGKQTQPAASCPAEFCASIAGKAPALSRPTPAAVRAGAKRSSAESSAESTARKPEAEPGLSRAQATGQRWRPTAQAANCDSAPDAGLARARPLGKLPDPEASASAAADQRQLERRPASETTAQSEPEQRAALGSDSTEGGHRAAGIGTVTGEPGSRGKKSGQEENKIEIVECITNWQTTSSAADSLSSIGNSKSQAPSSLSKQQRRRQQLKLKQQQVNSSNSNNGNNENNNNNCSLNGNNNSDSKEQQQQKLRQRSSNGNSNNINSDTDTDINTYTNASPGADSNANSNSNSDKNNSKRNDIFTPTEAECELKARAAEQAAAAAEVEVGKKAEARIEVRSDDAQANAEFESDLESQSEANANTNAKSSSLTKQQTQQQPKPKPKQKQQQQPSKQQQKSSLPSPQSFALVVASQNQNNKTLNSSEPEDELCLSASNCLASNQNREPQDEHSSALNRDDWRADSNSETSDSQATGMAQQQQDLQPLSPPATINNNNNIHIQDDAKSSFANSDRLAEQVPEQRPAGRESPQTTNLTGETSGVATDHQSGQQQRSDDDTNSLQQSQRVPSQQQQQQPQTTVLSQQPPANNRSILILREIDPDSSEEAVRGLFNSENCPSEPVHCEYALHNSWYVTFRNDEDAKHALAFIRKYIITWNGQPIMARYKPKPAAPSASNQPPPNIMPQHMVMQQPQAPTASVEQGLLQQQQQQVPPATMDTATTTTTTSMSHTAIAEGSAIASPIGQQAADQQQPPGGNLAPGPGPNGLLIYHHQAPSHSLMHPATHHPQMGLPGLVHQQHEPMHQHHPGYGYSAVAYCGQHGPILTPYHHYTNGPQYELSEVFTYNGLAPFPASLKSAGTTLSANGNSKLLLNGGGGVSSAALLGGEVPYHAHQHLHHHHAQHHNNHHQHYHQHPLLLGSDPTGAPNNGASMNSNRPYGHQRSHKGNFSHGNSLDYAKNAAPSNGAANSQQHLSHNQSASSNYSSSSGVSSSSQANNSNSVQGSNGNSNSNSSKRNRNSGGNRNSNVNSKQNVI